MSSSLNKLSSHASTILVSFFGFLFVHLVWAPWVSNVWMPVKNKYNDMGKRGRNNWCIHIVSTIHTLVVVPLAIRCLSLSTLDDDRAFGWDEKAGLAQAVACGYFLWDTLDSIVNFVDWGFVLHGMACSAIYMLSFTPFLAYYGVRFLLWETSTFFLNIHWFLDKMNKTGSTRQLINGIFLLLSFLFIRILWGAKMSFDFFRTLYASRNDVPRVYLVIYGVGNILLQALNWVWFTKMIGALRKRFYATEMTKANGVANENITTNGKYN